MPMPWVAAYIFRPAIFRSGTSTTGIPEPAIVHETLLLGSRMTPKSLDTYRSFLTASYATEFMGRSPRPLGLLPSSIVHVALSASGSYVTENTCPGWDGVLKL